MRCPVKNEHGEQCVSEAGHFPATKHALTAAHRCHATGCTRQVKPELLMCFPHWNRVPRAIQRAVWANYRHGQCDDMSPTEKWHDAADAAIGAVARKEGLPLSRVQSEALAFFESPRAA